MLLVPVFTTCAALAFLIVVPFSAMRGYGLRVSYIILSLIGLLSAGGCSVSIPSDAQLMQSLNSGSEELALGSQFLYTYGPHMATLWLALGVGNLLGAIGYRRKTAKLGRPPLPEGEKAIPITIKIRPDVLDKLRMQATEAGIGYQTLINEILEHATQ
jgi:hypothetical protein